MFKSFNMRFNIKLKIILTLISTFLILLIAFIAFTYISNKKDEYLKLVQKEELNGTMRSIMLLKTDQLRRLTTDYSCFDWMTHFVDAPNKSEAIANITPVTTYDLSFMQIYNLAKKQVYIDYSTPITGEVQIPPKVFDDLYKYRYIEFFMSSPYGPLQVVGSTIHPSTDLDKKTNPKGYLFVAKLWDSTYIKGIQNLINCRVSIFRAKQIPSQRISDTSYIPLLSQNYKVLYYLVLHKENTYINRINNLNQMFGWLIIVISVLIIAITLATYNKLVLKPLKIITYTLNTDSPENLIELGVRSDEFGKISRLIMEFFHQRKTLVEKLMEINFSNEQMESLNQELFSQTDELQAIADNLQIANTAISEKNEEIQKHREAIEYQNKEITESITYAKVIQDAVLSVPESFNNIFPEHFIFYQARNILSGDFYWIKEHNNKIYIAGADCTGHSLAGALLSMMGISFLNDILVQGGNMSAATILNKLRDYLVETLHQKGEFGEAHNGMDVVLCVIDPATNTLEYSGANNPLYIVAKNNETGLHELKSIKGEAMPVGIYVRNESFSNHTINLSIGDTIYITTDGFMDQFGGPLNKKYNSRRFKNLLLENSQKSMADQLDQITSEFNNWKGDNTQTDDVLIFCIRYYPVFQID